MPARGECPYITEALQSVSLNSLLPLEVIVVNDGMSQLAIEKVFRFSDRLNLKLINNEGSGLVDALNTGLRAAEGEFIARLDNDDVMHLNRLEMQIREFEINSRLVALGTECTYINPEGLKLGKSSYPMGILNSLPNFKTNCLLAHPSTMFRLNAATLIGGYRTVFSWNGTDIGEDFDFWLRLAKCGEIMNIPLELTMYRQHEGQLSMLNLAGQLIGTPYISAINLLPGEMNSTISFNGCVKGDREQYFMIIGKAFGSYQKNALMLQLFSIKLETLGIKILPKVIRKFVSILKRLLPSKL
jgi:glycosyltransferase involved in cell wall biosynthesis